MDVLQRFVNLFRSCMDAAAFTLQNWHHSLGSKLFRYHGSAMEMFTTWLHSFPTPVVWAAGNLCRPTLRNLVYNAYEINYESQKYTHVYSTVNTPIRGDCQNFTDCRNFRQLYSIRRQGQGRCHGFESGGGNFASRASKKNFLTPPLFGQWGGTKYCLDS